MLEINKKKMAKERMLKLSIIVIVIFTVYDHMFKYMTPK